MRGAYGKPNGLAARVLIGSKIMTIRTKTANLVHAQEALRRCKYKFPGRQNIVSSDKYGFTSLSTELYGKLSEQGRLQKVGDHVAVLKAQGKLTENSLLIVKSSNTKALAEESQ